MGTCAGKVYRPRQVKHSPLFRLVQEHWSEFKAVYEDRFEPYHGQPQPNARSQKGSVTPGPAAEG